ncbi:hypothetical protein BJ912DRAFT_1046586 [Pholiota molesta]|nr:hypothetical protein BJ912DRAFT_1046586 [Pholiota molesta]
MDPKLSVPQLPLEVLNHIFSFLRNDIPSLSACISATPYFQAIGEKHLWHHFTLHNHNTYDPNPRNGLSRSPAQLSKILADTPHVATYIRSLEISIASPSILQWFLKRSLNDEEMAPVLPMLPHLECISVAGGCISWDRLHQGFQAALIAYFGNLKWICWEELARALSSSHLGGLRRVELNVSFETTWNASLKPDEGLGILRNDQHLSELRRRGLFLCTLTNQPAGGRASKERPHAQCAEPSCGGNASASAGVTAQYDGEGWRGGAVWRRGLESPRSAAASGWVFARRGAYGWAGGDVALRGDAPQRAGGEDVVQRAER